MSKFFVVLCILYISLPANDKLVVTQQNVLYIQNMIKIEENIAKAFEKFILNEFKIPTFNELLTDEYLGKNFSVSNRFGEEISFNTASELKIKYAIKTNVEQYIKDLYNRDLYRFNTSVYEGNSFANSYVKIIFESKEAQTIYKILLNGDTIQKTCNATLKNTYCNHNQESIRWYTNDSYWIEYDKKEFENSHVTISDKSLRDSTRLTTLTTGVYIYVRDDILQFIKTHNSLAVVE
ncbi:hypothetical protein [Arcobacter sp. FWKO B]|uniref:hypothetical protein n=1 Tax=Arcobacter sp. FWKO B TaxID=2593672 RepID=UPI0018A6141B|nr:hypothetical protein [Arcobacter sp. FWKO B]QOG11225.1 hypothetical protein FWKOB_00325 [Arcobacter sp. FWKO B]